MATYKVPQNVEAEDKLVGPFTARQFIYLVVAAMGIVLAWGLGQISFWIALIPVPIIIVFGVLGIYHREDQPVESYLVAALNYFIKPRRHIWDTEGIVENVRITAPKRLIPPRLKRLESQRGQLKWLAHIMDTRGWSIKQPELTEPIANQALNTDDRLVVPQISAESPQPLEVKASDDVLDTTNNPEAAKFDELAAQAREVARQAALERMQKAKEAVAKAQAKEVATHFEPVVKTTDKKNAKPSKPLPKHVRFDPYPKNIAQPTLDPESGKFVTRSKAHEKKPDKSHKHPAKKQRTPAHPVLAQAYTRLARDDELPISEIARQAKRIEEKAISINEGQEINLHQQTGPA